MIMRLSLNSKPHLLFVHVATKVEICLVTEKNQVQETTVYGKKSFLSTESDTKILQSIHFAYKVGIISSYSRDVFRFTN